MAETGRTLTMRNIVQRIIDLKYDDTFTWWDWTISYGGYVIGEQTDTGKSCWDGGDGWGSYHLDNEHLVSLGVSDSYNISTTGLMVGGGRYTDVGIRKDQEFVGGWWNGAGWASSHIADKLNLASSTYVSTNTDTWSVGNGHGVGIQKAGSKDNWGSYDPKGAYSYGQNIAENTSGWVDDSTNISVGGVNFGSSQNTWLQAGNNTYFGADGDNTTGSYWGGLSTSAILAFNRFNYSSQIDSNQMVRYGGNGANVTVRAENSSNYGGNQGPDSGSYSGNYSRLSKITVSKFDYSGTGEKDATSFGTDTTSSFQVEDTEGDWGSYAPDTANWVSWTGHHVALETGNSANMSDANGGYSFSIIYGLQIDDNGWSWGGNGPGYNYAGSDSTQTITFSVSLSIDSYTNDGKSTHTYSGDTIVIDKITMGYVLPIFAHGLKDINAATGTVPTAGMLPAVHEEVDSAWVNASPFLDTPDRESLAGGVASAFDDFQNGFYAVGNAMFDVQSSIKQFFPKLDY